MAMGQNNEDICLFKKYFGYNNGDEIWIKACQATNPNPNKAGKYQFSYDPVSGRITSVGSVSKDPNNPMCVRIAPCNPNDKNQRFDVRDGRIYSRENSRVCAG